MYVHMEEEISTPSNLSALGQTHVAPHDSASASCNDQFHRSMQKRCEEQKLSRLRNDSNAQSPDRVSESRSNGKMARTGAENQRLGH
jgi:hypothetical protein